MSEPRIYRKNHIDSTCTFTGGNINIGATPYLYDRSIDYGWTSAGANSDATGVDLRVNFATSKYIDHIIMLGHNLPDSYEPSGYWNGTDWVALPNLVKSVVRENGQRAHTTLEFSGITTDKLLFYMLTTNIPNQEKVICEIIACAEGEIAYIRTDLSSYTPTFRQKSKEIPLGDGSLHVANTKNDRNSLLKYEANCQFKYLPAHEVKYLQDIKNEGGTFLFHPESQSRPQDIYLVRWAGNFSPRYTSSYKGAGWTVDMQVKEV